MFAFLRIPRRAYSLSQRNRRLAAWGDVTGGWKAHRKETRIPCRVSLDQPGLTAMRSTHLGVETNKGLAESKQLSLIIYVNCWRRELRLRPDDENLIVCRARSRLGEV